MIVMSEAEHLGGCLPCFVRAWRASFGWLVGVESSTPGGGSAACLPVSSSPARP